MAVEPRFIPLPPEELLKNERSNERDRFPTQRWFVIPPKAEEEYLIRNPKRTHVIQDVLMMSEPEAVANAKCYCLCAANEIVKRDRLDYSRVGYPGNLETVQGYLTTVETCPIDPLMFDSSNIDFSQFITENGQQTTQILKHKIIRFHRHLEATIGAYTLGRDNLIVLANTLITALKLPPFPPHDLSHGSFMTSLGS